jgi:hypothetical protein
LTLGSKQCSDESKYDKAKIDCKTIATIVFFDYRRRVDNTCGAAFGSNIESLSYKRQLTKITRIETIIIETGKEFNLFCKI